MGKTIIKQKRKATIYRKRLQDLIDKKHKEKSVLMGNIKIGKKEKL